MKVTLLGPVPPPHGGVSVHVERLKGALETLGVAVSWENEQAPEESFFSFLQRVMMTAGRGIVHSHVHNPWTLWALGMRATLGMPTVVTLHNPRLHDWLKAMPRWKARLVRGRIHALHGYIAVSEPIREMLLELGVMPEKIIVEPAFLPPSRKQWESAPVPAKVESFLKQHAPVVAMNAFHLDNHETVPLYGADMGPELIAGLRQDYPEAGLVLYVATEPSQEQAEALQVSVEKWGVGESFLMVTGSEPFGPLLVRAQTYVRPTATDGDSVSVREALAVGVPVVASDVCGRPEGVRVFEARDSQAFLKTVASALTAGPGEPDAHSSENPVQPILELYSTVLGGD